jgi:esterase/lipase superfamily enzyme
MSQLLSTLQGEPTVLNELLISIHGFNVDWEDAVLSAWKLYQNVLCCSESRMPMLAYVWPSVAGQHKSALFYPWDTLVVIGRAAHSLRAVLMEALAEVPSHVVAHSMGNKGLVKALSHHDLTSDLSHSFAFVAPDVDANEFMSRAAKFAVRGNATLYCNNHDGALALSFSLRLWGWGARGYRAGSCEPAPLVVQPPHGHLAHFNTVQVVGYDNDSCKSISHWKDKYAHSYHVFSATVGQDILYFMRGNFAARSVQVKQQVCQTWHTWWGMVKAWWSARVPCRYLQLVIQDKPRVLQPDSMIVP